METTNSLLLAFGGIAAFSGAIGGVSEAICALFRLLALMSSPP